MTRRLLNMDCTSLMLDYLSEIDVWKYEKAIPFDKEAVNSYWERKKKIVVEEISRDDYKILLHVLKLCSNLTEFRLEEIDDGKYLRKLPTVISKNCINIQTLVLDEMLLFNEHILELSNCSKLRSLTLKCKANDDTLETLFLSLPSLEELTLYDYGRIKGNCILALSKVIKMLDLCFTYQLNCNRLTQAIKNFYRLESLSIRGLNGSDFALESIPTLRSLELISMSFQMNSVINCKLLKELQITGSDPIENEFIISLVKNCALLEVLNIGSLSFSVTTEGIANLGNLPKLRELGIIGHFFCTAGCPQYTQCMSSISNCQNLQSLRVFTCGITNFAVSQIIEHCKELIFIEINECNISSDLVAMAVDKLNNQNNRTNILEMELFIAGADINLQEMRATHPLLEVSLLEPKDVHKCNQI